MVFIRAITRTKGRLIRLYETVSDEYNRTHRYFESYGTSLHLPDIFRRGSITGLAMILVIAAATIPMILYYHGLSNPMLFVYFIFELFCCFWLFFFLVWIAHLLWALAYSVGSKIGGSRFLWGYIGLCPQLNFVFRHFTHFIIHSIWT